MQDFKEEWKAVVGFEDDYEVSSCGRVRRSSDGYRTYVGRILNPSRNGSGYDTVNLHKEGCNAKLVHRLVAEAFCGPLAKGMQVNHLNGCKSDNRANNLEIITQRENELHAVRLGLKPEVLTEEKAREIRTLKGAESSRTLAKKYGVHHETICRIWRGQRWITLS